MNTPKVRSWARNSNLYSIWKKLNTKLCIQKKNPNTKLCIWKKTTAKLSLALFLGISFCYCFFEFSEFIFFLKNRRFFLIHHFFTFYLLCYFSDPYIINIVS